MRSVCSFWSATMLECEPDPRESRTNLSDFGDALGRLGGGERSDIGDRLEKLERVDRVSRTEESVSRNKGGVEESFTVPRFMSEYTEEVLYLEWKLNLARGGF